MRAIRDGLGTAEVPLEYFLATHDDEDEAVAMHNLHVSRVAFAQQSQNADVPADGGLSGMGGGFGDGFSGGEV